MNSAVYSKNPVLNYLVQISIDTVALVEKHQFKQAKKPDIYTNFFKDISKVKVCETDSDHTYHACFCKISFDIVLLREQM